MIRLTPTMPLSATVPLSSGGEDAAADADDQEDDGSAEGDRQGRREPREQVVGDVDPQLEGDTQAGRVALDGDGAGLEVVADEDALHVLAVLLGDRPVEAEAAR